MSTTRLKRYRHFPTPPDAQALVMLLRLTAIDFEIRYERGANFDRARHEPDRVEVWIRAADYAYVQRLEAALTREQALALAVNTLPDDQLRSVMESAAPRPPDAQAVAGGGLTHRSNLQAVSASATSTLTTVEAIKYWLPMLLILAGLAALAFCWLG